MTIDEFREAAESVGGVQCGVAAVILPEKPVEEIDGYAIAVFFPLRDPICFVTQVGSAPRRDMQRLRSALRDALCRSRQPKLGLFTRIRNAFARIHK